MANVDEAVQILLRATAPGHVDAVANGLQSIAPQSFSKNTNDGTIWAQFQKEHRILQCLEQQQQQQNSSPSKHVLAASLTLKLQQYQEQNFAGKPGVTYRMAMTDGEGNINKNQLVVHTYVEKVDTPNQISGYWKATWTIDGLDDSDTSGAVEMSGRVQVHSYAHEEGNAQVKVDKTFPSTNVGTKTDSMVQAIMKQITSWESQVLAVLAGMNQGGTTGDQMKSIRRVLPITKTKMKWDVVAQRSVKTLKKTAPGAKSKVNYGS